MELKRDSWLVRWAFLCKDFTPETVGFWWLCCRAVLLFMLWILVKAIFWLIVFPLAIVVAFLIGYRPSRPKDEEHAKRIFVPIEWLPEIKGFPVIPLLFLTVSPAVVYLSIVLISCDWAKLYQKSQTAFFSENLLDAVYITAGVILGAVMLTSVYALMKVMLEKVFKVLDGPERWQSFKRNFLKTCKQAKEWTARHAFPEVRIVD